jgi:SAM-dependent methyltransferase
MPEQWSEGHAYDGYMGRWSRGVAEQFVNWLQLPPGLRWLDVGCGTGALSSAVLAHAQPDRLLGVDPSERFVAWCTSTVDDARARFTVADATHLAEIQADVVVSGLVLNFVHDPADAVDAMAAVAPAGTVAAYVWDYAGQMDLLRHFWDAAVELDRAAAELDEGIRFPICRPERLAALWLGAGLQDVSTHHIDVPTDFVDFDDYWTPFLSGQGPAPGYVRSLDGPGRDALRDALRRRLPAAADGGIHLTARAWAVRGRVAGSDRTIS